MNKFYLINRSNSINIKSIIKKKWYHGLFGKPFRTIDVVEAKNISLAQKKFQLKGYRFGNLN